LEAVSASEETHRAIRAVWSLESAKLIARLTRMVRDVGLAEELAQDALVAALERWPESGVPDKPGAWLMATAKHKAINVLRRGQWLERKHEEVGHELDALKEDEVAALDEALDDEVGDDVLRLLFIACHPVLSPDARVALTLRLRAASAPTRSRARSWSPRPPSRSASCAPSGRWRRSRSPSRCRAGPSSRRASSRCSR
jgi:predicted RNA polymerase sigma factor